MDETGIFAGPIAGLKYKTPTCHGITNVQGEFHYRAGERVVFRVGEIAIGSAPGAARVNLAGIISRVDGNIQKLHDPGLTNVARFLCSLDRDGDLDGGIEIAPEVHDIVGSRSIDFRGDVSFAARVEHRVRDFEQDQAVADLLEELGQGGAFTARTPRRLCSAAAARNEVRRAILGSGGFAKSGFPSKTAPTSLRMSFGRTKTAAFL